jgi:glycerate 2-kinase
MSDRTNLSDAARQIFTRALKAVDANTSVRNAIRVDNSRLVIGDTTFDVGSGPSEIFAVAVGKAAFQMAMALDEILGNRLSCGVVSGTIPNTLCQDDEASAISNTFAKRWRVFRGSHPLPTEESLAAARASFELLERANKRGALVIFLISGGGSSMIEWPCDKQTTLADLRLANHRLVTCGATIAEVNAVRRTFSEVKGGGLSRRAPLADQISLIVSDTAVGEDWNVASGPTLTPPSGAPDARSVVESYELASQLPESIRRAIERGTAKKADQSPAGIRHHYVLLDNTRVIAEAAAAARAREFTVEIARDITEQHVTEGCDRLLMRLRELRRRAGRERIICVISGGEFKCPVVGAGVGGRNAETALRWAIDLDARPDRPALSSTLPRLVALSAGTDGIDGNSLAAGALADELSLTRARLIGLDAQGSLEASDAYTFFEALGDTLMTGATGTNVRDLRVLLASGEV